ncbi:MAG TPA: hypothetical protein V6C91_09800 [Coleofasciculaceae cyanobacterium]
MEFIANHEVYQGMPDAFTEGNKIQWEAPSNPHCAPTTVTRMAVAALIGGLAEQLAV